MFSSKEKSESINFEAVADKVTPVDAQALDVATTQLYQHAVFFPRGHQSSLQSEQQGQTKLVQERDSFSHKEVNNDVLRSARSTMNCISTIEAKRVM